MYRGKHPIVYIELCTIANMQWGREWVLEHIPYYTVKYTIHDVCRGNYYTHHGWKAFN